MAGTHGFHFAAEGIDVLSFIVRFGGDRGQAADARALGVGLLLLGQAGLQAGDLPAQVRQVFLFGHFQRLFLRLVFLLGVDLVVAVALGGDDQQLRLTLVLLGGGLLLELHVFELVISKVGLFGGGQFLLVGLVTGAFLVALGDKVRFVRGVVALELGEGHFQGMGGGALFFRGEIDPENKDAMEGQRQKYREGEAVVGADGGIGCHECVLSLLLFNY